MKISLIQSDIAWNDPARNVECCRALALEALASQGQVLIFPEMFTCGFSIPAGELAQRSSERGLDLLQSIAVENSVYTIGSLPEIAEGGTLYNTAWLFGPDGSNASYRKIHPFSYGGESETYSPGSVLCTTPLRDRSNTILRCSMLICYDLRFAPLFWACAPETDLFVVVANWPATRREHWLTLLRARAIENQAYVAGVNRVGIGGGLPYSGDSVVFAPDGTELCRLGDSQGVLTCDVEPATVSSWRATLPALRDRRGKLYQTFGAQ
jgi:predicted amidohydrolase